MKLKKVAAICAKQGAYYLFDEVEENGELIRQWLGDGRSAYPLSGLPVLDEENLCAMFDITEKRRKKCVLARKPMPDGMSVEDYAKGERELYDEWPTVEHNGYVVKPLSTNDDMLFIPIRPDEFSFSGLLDLVEQVESAREAVNPGLTLRGAFFTHWQNRETFWQSRFTGKWILCCPPKRAGARSGS